MISPVIIPMLRFCLIIIIVSLQCSAENQYEQNHKDWKYSNVPLAKLRGRREGMSLSKLKSLNDDDIANYYSTIFNREPSPEKSYLSQILHQAGSLNLLESDKKRIESSSERSHISSDSSSIKTQIDLVTNLFLNKTHTELVQSTSLQTPHENTTSNEILGKLSNGSSLPIYLGLFTDESSKSPVTPLSSTDRKPTETSKRTTEYFNNPVRSPFLSTSETPRNIFLMSSTSNNSLINKNYAPILLLMAHKFDEIEQNLQTFKANQLFLAHKVKKIYDKLESKDSDTVQIIRPNINKIIEQLINVGTEMPASSYEALSNLTNSWNRA
ncbi:uncharacterized protein LOC111043325 [Nilaparvata lugens]|uniref:uncharacterized protein LOC111043325 n=1 Tax=Nilaparvata lugens TaxID=108931 RepID=UPI00193D4F95|nr:uncharacterized protein LOC111043325 [Nilaparvata lugens]